MYRMLIVDDEREIVDSLYELFIMQSFPKLDIFKAYSSKEAITFLNTMKIDILLTDIRMPVMNGLQLAEMARENWPKCNVIFLTGYNEFDYAYSAIKGSCADYLLKTESDSEIIQAIEKAIQKIEKDLQDEALVEKAKSQVKAAAPLLQRKYVMDIIDGLMEPSEILQEKFNELRINLNINSRVYLILGRMDEVTQEDDMLSSTHYSAVMKDLMGEVLLRYPNKICIEYDNASFVCFIQEKREDKKANEGIYKIPAEDIAIIRGTLETIQNVCSKSLDTTVSFSLCSEPVEWKQVYRKFRLIKKMMDFSTGIGVEAILTDKSFSRNMFERITDYGKDILKDETLNIRNIEALTYYLERGNKAEYFRHLTRMIDGLRSIKSKNNPFAQEVYYTVASCLLSYINRWTVTEAIAFKIGIYKLTRADLHASWNDAAEYICSLSNELFEMQKNNQNNIMDTSVKYIQQYIRNHLNEDLTLSRLAELVYFNPSYLSRLFKQTTGINISDYIIESRLIKAKDLLAQTDLMINEIAQMLGLQSPIYFARIFKKCTNMSPQEYRELCYKR